MRVALNIEIINETTARVNSINYIYDGEPTENMVFFEGEIPQPEILIGKNFDMLFDLTTNTIFYEYRDRPLTQEERLMVENAQLKADILEQKTVNEMNTSVLEFILMNFQPLV